MARTVNIPYTTQFPGGKTACTPRTGHFPGGGGFRMGYTKWNAPLPWQQNNKRRTNKFRLLVKATNGAALLDETGAKYEAFIRLLNEDVNYYRSVVLQKRTASGDEPAPQPESAD